MRDDAATKRCRRELIHHMKTPVFLLLVALFTTMLSIEVTAHPGPTDADGCHVDPKTGKWHCH